MIIDILLKHLKKTPDKLALVVGDRELTYDGLLKRVAATSQFFEEIGIQAHSHILLALKNSAEFVIVMLAAAHRGAVIVPVNPTLKSDAILKAIESSDAQYAVVEDHLLASISSLQKIPADRIVTLQQIENLKDASIDSRPLSGDENFIITMTSGSTGDPKPIVFSQKTKITRAESAWNCYHLDASVVGVAATPLYHSLAQRMVFVPLLAGGTAVVMPNFTAKLWLETVASRKISFSILVSSQLASIHREYSAGTYDLGSLKTLVSSSAAISKDLKESLVKTFHCEIHEIYGASEVGVVTNLSPRDGAQKLSTVGKALPNIDLKIVDSQGVEVEEGQVGEIICKSPTGFVGYYKRKEATEAAMRNGYFHTGDLGSLDGDGFLTFMGRSKDIIIVGGINVYPADIEKVIVESGWVEECAVIGVQDQMLGEAVLAVVVPKKSDLNISRELQKLCSKKLADFQQPFGFEILEALPRNAMGKIDKVALRSQFAHLDLTKNFRGIFRPKSLKD